MTLFAIAVTGIIIIAVSLIATLIVVVLLRKPESARIRRNIIYGICPLYIIGVLLFSISTYFSSKAIKYGAFGDFRKVETISSVMEHTDKGYIESDNIPEDLRGSIVIYFKYGCPDCAGIHDELVELLQKYPDNRIYFVSTRSETGKKILEQYHIDVVPSAIYVPYNGYHHIEILYNYKKQPEDPVIFISENFETLITMQNEDQPQ